MVFVYRQSLNVLSINNVYIVFKNIETVTSKSLIQKLNKISHVYTSTGKLQIDRNPRIKRNISIQSKRNSIETRVLGLVS